MASLSQLLLTARDALSAQSYGLGVAGQNVTNVNTPGYVRRTALLETRSSSGVVAVGVQRATDQFLERRWLQASSTASAASERQTLLGAMEPMFADGSRAGLAGALDAVFSAFQTLSANPSDPTARQSVLDKADALTARIREQADAIAGQRQELLRRAQDEVAAVNAKAAKIADLDRQIVTAEAHGEDASDLRDQRNQLLLGLAALVDVRTFTDANGGLVVQSAGTTLVEGGHAQTWSIDLAADGSMRLLSQSGGPPATDLTSHLSGGSLAAIHEVRDTDLTAIATGLDQFAWDVGTAVNARHAAGFGLDGLGGRALFSLSAGPTDAARTIALDVNMAAHPDWVAASGSASAGPGDSDNATKLAQLADENVASSGTRTAAEAWSDLAGDVGSRAQQANDEAELRTDIQSQAEAARESTSGVALDEEMVALTKFQHAYDAAAKVLATVDELMRELLDKVGR